MGLKFDHDLDAGGDVLLTLQNPNEPFAVWGEDEHWELPRPPPPVPKSEHLSGYRLFDPAWIETEQAEPVDQFAFGDDAPVVEEVPADQFETFQQDMPEVPVEPQVLVGLSNLSVEQAPEASEVSETAGARQMLSEDDEVVSNEVSQVRFRLSSRHLILASSYFRAMLTGPWEENASRTESFYNVSATDWDEDALQILMDIIHGNSQKVPRSISLELLAKIAVLVDYYKCHDVVRFFSDTWIETLRNEGGVTQEYCRDFVLWLFVSHVFAQPETFRNLTFVAVQQTRGPLRMLGLPMPDSISSSSSILPVYPDISLTTSTDEIERRRQDGVQSILSSFHDLLEYFCTRDCCSFECSSILLGSLYKEMIAKGILSPRPAPPFLGISIKEMSLLAREMRSPDWYTKPKSIKRYSSAHPCQLHHFFGPRIDQIEDRIKGLELVG
ncbi:hypothetical protein N8I77_009260 [Diaporthe amygdali]|uniref:BTB domain-containing protein n=1 Tax=Phomopsis amygdali TaxID=1214568 RepID=A0AAD9SC95_PHOAM|nr:hypothetical protein N8I77_009260 [Diaporthe amygdali]